jgi:enolase-phosphatase E1
MTSHVRGILLDIEGTTTPIAFVHEVLFPYAKARIREYVAAHFHSSDVHDDLAKLREDHARDIEQNLEPPPLVHTSQHAEIDTITHYIHWLIDRDRKSTGLKSLQGKIWRQGYEDGALKAPLFADVTPALERWHKAGLKIAIFSSGSSLAQQLLFAHTSAGDLTKLIDSYFDTTTGPKIAVESYRRISSALNLTASDIVFISDIVGELDAARSAGMQILLCVRPGNHPQPRGTYQVVQSFAPLFQ